jgi:hypothetical protein
MFKEADFDQERLPKDAGTQDSAFVISELVREKDRALHVTVTFRTKQEWPSS